MGLKLKVTAEIEFSEEELHKAIDEYIQKAYNYPVKKIEFRKGKLFAIVDHAVDRTQGFERVSNPLIPTKEFTRKWNGLYGAVGEILDAQRKRKKKFISFEDLRAELLSMEDLAHNKMFVKDGEELPMSVIKQRLAPSQIVRQAKSQPNLRGVKYDKAGLKF